MTLLDEIKAAQAQLEATRRRKGIVTAALVRDALPPFLRNQASTSDLANIARHINFTLDHADPVSAPPTIDHQSRAAGDANG